MATYKITVDSEACIGDKMCREEAPNTFGVDDEGKTVVANPDGDQPEHIRRAAKRCPMQAIILRDAVSDEQVWPEVVSFR